MNIKWQQIIRKIQQLHRRGEPLNITAVKRSHPELIRAVYKARPFRGWKQALEDAKIDYANIKVELQDTVECELCGKSFRNLGNHLILKHEVRPNEYLMDYPDAELQSETLRAAKKIGGNRFLRHWEPVWTREYALDRLAEYRRRGLPIHQSKLDQYDVALSQAIMRHCNGLKDAIVAIGLDPLAITKEAYYRLHRYQDKESVIAGIKARQRRGLNLSRRALMGSGTEKKTDCALFRYGGNLFGSWDKALRAAGIDPKVVRMSGLKKEKYPSPESVIKELRERIKRKWPVNNGALWCGLDANITLARSGKYYFGSWKKTLQAVGIDAKVLTAELCRRNRRYPDRQSVTKAIRRRIRRGMPVSPSGMTTGNHRDPLLYERCREYFGSGPQALQAAGVDAKVLTAELFRRSRRYPDRQSVLKAIKRRIRRGIPVNSFSLKNGKHCDYGLIERGKEYFGSWSQALKAAGVTKR